MLGLPEQLLMFMLVHLLLAPFDNTSHRLTSLFLFLRNIVSSKGVKHSPFIPLLRANRNQPIS
jgi:hypothetical protein